MSPQIFSHLKNVFPVYLSFKSLCILNRSDISLTNISSQYDLSFFSLIMSFTKQTFLILIKPNLLICLVLNCASSGIPKQFLPSSKSQRISPIFYYRSIIILGFTFRSMTHFEIIFNMDSQLSQCHLLR